MELRADEERMILEFNHLHKPCFGIATAGNKTYALKVCEISIVEFVTVAMALADFGCSIYIIGKRTLFKLAFIGAQTHCSSLYCYCFLVFHK